MTCPWLSAALLALATGVSAQPAPSGQVEIPIDVYNQLVEAARAPSRAPRPLPAAYALGNARVQVAVAGDAGDSAEVRVELALDILEDEWVLVPILPSGTPVESVRVGGQVVQLVPSPEGLAWITKQKGSWTMSLVYRVDAQRSSGGRTLALPLPRAAAIQLDATLPGQGLDVTVIPGAGTRVTAAGAQTRVTATLPSTSGAQLAWRVPGGQAHSLSRASYSGRLVGGAVVWTGELGVELFGGATTTLPLFPRSVTLSTLKVDGEDAPVLLEGDHFAVPLRGAGRHEVTLGFETPVLRKDGPPRVELRVPATPISRFELTLPGRKELSVTPAASVASRFREGATVSTLHVPMTQAVSVAWSEAVPEEVRAEVRSNATLYHAAWAEEGVLYLHALIRYEMTRGATNTLELQVPAGVQVNRILSPSGAVADWRVEPAPAGRPRTARVFLDRQVEGEFQLDVYYDRSLPTDGELVAIPLLDAPGAQRQRGMLALLASADLTLDPEDDAGATRVGENQLPAFVREMIDRTVAHTFKYSDAPPSMAARARAPDPIAARFDVQVDTLLSLGEVAVTGSASLEIHVKSGRVAGLEIELPEDASLLDLSAPSLRTHRSAVSDGLRVVQVEFTQEMEGQFRVELGYERILATGEDAAEVAMPLARVRGAEVQQGRLAVEALSAVEVQPATAERLTLLDLAELPQQLVLRTSNPILMAWKYLQTEPLPRLALTLTRHQTASVQEAAIDEASYRTLFTRDGLVVTTANFTVRNSRKQFLRVRLPAESEVWSVLVDGRADKPAISEAENNNGTAVLVKIIHSTKAFPVQLVYATRLSPLGSLGTAEARLARPDILVTRTRWDVYLPDEMSYAAPSTNLEPASEAERVTREELQAGLAGSADATARQVLDPLRISVPTSGIHYAFEKLYANQSDHDAWVAIPYATRSGSLLGRLASALGALLLWGGVGLMLRPVAQLHPRMGPALAAFGLVLVLAAASSAHVGLSPALFVTALAGATLLALRWRLDRSGNVEQTLT
jgi:hypothetical protein